MTIRIERMASPVTVVNSYPSTKTPTEVPNGAIVIFTAPEAYEAGTLKVWRDQLTLQPGVDFAETSPSAGTYTLTSAPETGEKVWHDYIRA